MADKSKYTSLPAEIRSGLFAPWQYKQIAGERKKIYFTPYGTAAKPNRPGDWASLDAALSCLEIDARFEGIGTLLTEGSEVAFVDIDKCLDRYSNLTTEAAEIVYMLDSYTEYSPSFLGLHIAFLVPHKGWTYDDSRYYMHSRSCELYTPGMTTRAMTVTAEPFGPRREIRRLTEEEMQRFLDTYLKRDAVRPAERIITAPIGGNGMTWHEIYSVLRKSSSYPRFEALFRGDFESYNHSRWVKGTGEIDQSMYDAALCCLLAFWTGGNRALMDAVFRRSALMRPKWDTKNRGSMTYGDRTISAAISHCSNFYMPPLPDDWDLEQEPWNPTEGREQ